MKKLILLLLFIPLVSFGQDYYNNFISSTSAFEYEKGTESKIAEEYFHRGTEILEELLEFSIPGKLVNDFFSESANSLKKAIIFFQQAIAYDSEYAEAYGNMAYCYQALDMHNEAIENYLLELKILPNSQTALNGLAQSYININMFKNAETTYEKLLNLNMKGVTNLENASIKLTYPLYGLGQLYYLTKDYEKSRIFAGSAAELADKHNFISLAEDALLIVAKSDYAAGNKEVAQALFDELLKRDHKATQRFLSTIW